MLPHWQGLFANFAILVLFVTGWLHVQDTRVGLLQRGRSLTLGVWFGLGAVALMRFPFVLQEGVVFDLRNAPIAIAGLFGGPAAGLVAGGLAAAMRTWINGTGMASGLAGIAAVTIVGIVAHVLLGGREAGRRDVALTALGSAAGVAGILLLPREVRAAAITHVAPLTALLSAVGTLVAGLALVQERRRRAAAEANHMYRAIIEALPDCLNAKDLNGRFVAANPATVALMHAERTTDLIGATDFDFYPPEVARQFRHDEAEMLAAGKPTTMEQPFTRRDGSTGWLDTLKAPYRDASGRIVGIITHNRDVTELRRLRESLARSQQRLAEALTHLGDGLALFDEEGRLVYRNAHFGGILPRSAHRQTPGRHIRDILAAALDEGEIAVDPGAREAWLDSMCVSLRESGVSQLMLANGRWIEWRRRQTSDGSCLLVLADITIAKVNEASLVSAKEALDSIARTDPLTDLPNRRAGPGCASRLDPKKSVAAPVR